MLDGLPSEKQIGDLFKGGRPLGDWYELYILLGDDIWCLEQQPAADATNVQAVRVIGAGCNGAWPNRSVGGEQAHILLGHQHAQRLWGVARRDERFIEDLRYLSS